MFDILRNNSSDQLLIHSQRHLSLTHSFIYTSSHKPIHPEKNKFRHCCHMDIKVNYIYTARTFYGLLKDHFILHTVIEIIS